MQTGSDVTVHIDDVYGDVIMGIYVIAKMGIKGNAAKGRASFLGYLVPRNPLCDTPRLLYWWTLTRRYH